MLLRLHDGKFHEEQQWLRVPVSSKKVYRDFCPMADNNKGAFWLSLEEEIRNPYYGEAMLKCGEVRETIE